MGGLDGGVGAVDGFCPHPEVIDVLKFVSLF